MNSRRPSSFIAQFLFLIFSWFMQMGNSRDVNGSRLFQLNDCTCLGYTQVFECSVFGGGFTVWNSTFFDCHYGRNEIWLRHSRYDGVDSPAYGDCNHGAVIAKSIGVFDSCYTSHLIVTIGEEMINKTIECSGYTFEGRNAIIGQQLLVVTEIPYPPPSNIRVESIDFSRLTFAWDEATTQCSSLQYVITAINCGVCPYTTADKNVTCVLSDISLHIHNTCLFAVQTEICGDLLGERSEYVTVHIGSTFSIPDPLQFKLRFHYSSKKINATVEIVFAKGSVLENTFALPISYIIAYSDTSSGRICDSATIPTSSCLNRVCCHTFGEVSPPCSLNGDISITVFATSTSGDGTPSQPLIFSLKSLKSRDKSMTGELVFPVTVGSLGAALVLVIAVFTVTTIKLQKDKRRLIKSMAVQGSPGVDMKNSSNQTGDYENIELYDQKAATKTVDIEVNKNPAYSTAKDL